MTDTAFAIARRGALSLTGLSMLLMLCGCSQRAEQKADNAQVAAAGPNFDRDIQPIFDANCVACHQSEGASGKLNLESGAAYGAVVSVRSGESPLLYVMPGRADQSYLIRKVEGTHVEAGGSGERMPLTGPLDARSIATLRDWVRAGAPRD
ncbi:hypothetical protein C100_00235 [Sphingobium sp. C100]|jgi:mono/diheme cytochrome c family protein|uniref:c-type cytochrome domain-containing protein n=1 Tax=Sphingobium sp. C100 TaxID=1207055 RepID=UPI0003D5EBB9|nr:c-type cytochrome domain-containing protein [Sphingobium sp. C100]ETI65761.1 hypothetical protein C100_00235 [Sphingobium sp. C100]PHQ63072.1 MAG: hypothetical protein COC10_08115 [Sphingobium sp.]